MEILRSKTLHTARRPPRLIPRHLQKRNQHRPPRPRQLPLLLGHRHRRQIQPSLCIPRELLLRRHNNISRHENDVFVPQFGEALDCEVEGVDDWGGGRLVLDVGANGGGGGDVG